MEPLRLYLSVPVAGFRVAQAREYWETYPCPPPSTVYGMLLSMVGEPNRLIHQGAEIATALLCAPERSVILRTLWRIKNRKAGQGQANNKRPDFQELLTGVKLAIWVRSGPSEQTPTLAQRVVAALENPAGVTRFGAVALGESTHLVDEIRSWRRDDPSQGRVLTQDPQGELTLPVWPDHVGSKNTKWAQFSLQPEAKLPPQPPPEAWVNIRRLQTEE